MESSENRLYWSIGMYNKILIIAKYTLCLHWWISCVQGRVQFNEVGSRFQARSQIFQYRLNQSNGQIVQLQCIAQTEYRNSSNTATIVYLDNESSATVYPGTVMHDCIFNFTLLHSWLTLVFWIILLHNVHNNINFILCTMQTKMAFLLMELPLIKSTRFMMHLSFATTF